MKNHFKGRHFQKDIIIVAVGYYFRFSLSYRAIVEILNDRGIIVNHKTVMRLVNFYGPLLKRLWKKNISPFIKAGEWTKHILKSKVLGIIYIEQLISIN